MSSVAPGPPVPDALISDKANNQIPSDGHLAGEARVAEASSELVVPMLRCRYRFLEPDAACRAETATAAVQLPGQRGVRRQARIEQHLAQVGAVGDLERMTLVARQNRDGVHRFVLHRLPFLLTELAATPHHAGAEAGLHRRQSVA